MMGTLAQQYPEVHRDLALKGYKCIAHLMTVFDKQTQMDRALDLNGATSNWCRGKNVPAMTIEKRANDFIACRALGTGAPAKADPEKPTPGPAIEISPASETEATFLVVGPLAQAQKIQKIVSLLGCEVVEV